MSYNPQLSYFLDRLSGFSTNVFRLEPQASPASGPNKIVRFTLPANALLNMRTFTMYFTAEASSGTGSLECARLPAKIDSLIERVEVSAGGVQLSQGLNFYNVLRHAKDALYGNKSNSTLSHPEIVRSVSYVDGQSKLADEIYPGKELFAIDHWEGFLGTCEPKIIDAALLPELVVTVYLADIKVLSLTGGSASKQGSALINFAGPDNPLALPGTNPVTYSLDNIHATIECIGLADAVYDNMVASMIAAKGFIEIPFKQYFSFNNTHTGNSRFTVATQSLDRVWACFRDGSYQTLKPPISVEGYQKPTRKIQKQVNSTNYPHGHVALVFPSTTTAYADYFYIPQHGLSHGSVVEVVDSTGTQIAAFASATTASNNVGNVNVISDDFITISTSSSDPGDSSTWITYSANYDDQFIVNLSAHAAMPALGHVFDSASEKYVGNYYNFVEPGTGLTYQMQLNGAYYPQFPAKTEEVFQISNQSLLGYKCQQDLTLEQYKKNYFVQCYRLNLPDSEFSRTISGLDTRAVSLQGYFTTTGTVAADTNLVLFCECTSTLRVGSARQMEVIV